MLLEPEDKTALRDVLTYHVVAGNLDAKWLMTEARKHNGSLELKTVNGAPCCSTAARCG